MAVSAPVVAAQRPSAGLQRASTSSAAPMAHQALVCSASAARTPVVLAPAAVAPPPALQRPRLSSSNRDNHSGSIVDAPAGREDARRQVGATRSSQAEPQHRKKPSPQPPRHAAPYMHFSDSTKAMAAAGFINKALTYKGRVFLSGPCTGEAAFQALRALRSAQPMLLRAEGQYPIWQPTLLRKQRSNNAPGPPNAQESQEAAHTPAAAAGDAFGLPGWLLPSCPPSSPPALLPQRSHPQPSSNGSATAQQQAAVSAQDQGDSGALLQPGKTAGSLPPRHVRRRQRLLQLQGVSTLPPPQYQQHQPSSVAAPLAPQAATTSSPDPLLSPPLQQQEEAPAQQQASNTGQDTGAAVPASGSWELRWRGRPRAAARTQASAGREGSQARMQARALGRGRGKGGRGAVQVVQAQVARKWHRMPDLTAGGYRPLVFRVHKLIAGTMNASRVLRVASHTSYLRLALNLASALLDQDQQQQQGQWQGQQEGEARTAAHQPQHPQGYQGWGLRGAAAGRQGIEGAAGQVQARGGGAGGGGGGDGDSDGASGSDGVAMYEGLVAMDSLGRKALLVSLQAVVMVRKRLRRMGRDVAVVLQSVPAATAGVTASPRANSSSGGSQSGEAAEAPAGARGGAARRRTGGYVAPMLNRLLLIECAPGQPSQVSPRRVGMRRLP